MANAAPSPLTEVATPRRDPRRAMFEAITRNEAPSISVDQLNMLQGERDDIQETLENSSPGYREPGQPNRTPAERRAMEVWERTPITPATSEVAEQM